MLHTESLSCLPSPLYSQDNGKPLSVAKAADVPLTVDHLRYFAG